jgi:DNA-binding transcriptional LysR family regulator
LPDVAVTLKHGTSSDILSGIREGTLDAGFYNEAAEPDPDLTTVEVSQFRVYAAAAPGLVRVQEPLDWGAMADLPWIYPTASACCGRAAESLFRLHKARPKRIISVDREDVTRTLVGSGIGIGLLHAGTTNKAKERGELEVLLESPTLVRVLFAYRASRADDPLLDATAAILSNSRT